ncbi:MAG: SDR family NAD(P)-dependent oxidoreductase, partial [Betaproteobacteria bacterium]
MGNQAEVARRPETWRDENTPVTSRIVFVSGGMGGIGTAVCRRLGAAGHTVVAGCLPGYERKSEWLDAMRATGYRVHAAEGDVAHFDSCAEMFYNVRSVVGPIDILVNNAGITRDAVFKRMTEQDWMAVIN